MESQWINGGREFSLTNLTGPDPSKLGKPSVYPETGTVHIGKWLDRKSLLGN
jgi:hypothetical protein